MTARAATVHGSLFAMNKIKVLAVVLVLSGCTTPRTMLQNPKNGQLATCGGSVTPAGLFYYMQKSSDSDCVADYAAQGFKPIAIHDNSGSK